MTVTTSQFHVRVECTRLNEACFCHFLAMCAVHGYFSSATVERAKDVMGRLRRSQWQVVNMRNVLGPLAKAVLQTDVRPTPRDTDLPALEGVLKALLGRVVERFAVLAAPDAAARGASCLPPAAFVALVRSLHYFRRTGRREIAAALRAPSVVAGAAAAAAALASSSAAAAPGVAAAAAAATVQAAAAAEVAVPAVPGGVTAEAARMALTSLMRAEFLAMGGPLEGFQSPLCDTPGARLAGWRRGGGCGGG